VSWQVLAPRALVTCSARAMVPNIVGVDILSLRAFELVSLRVKKLRSF
jgi:hypothetical protein